MHPILRISHLIESNDPLPIRMGFEAESSLVVLLTLCNTTSVARKRPWSFCRKCSWQVTAKYACTLHVWLACSDMVHGCMVYTECAKMAAVSCGTSHASTVSTPLWWIFKNVLWKASHSCRIYVSLHNESAWERRIALYKSDQQHQQQPCFSS